MGKFHPFRFTFQFSDLTGRFGDTGPSVDKDTYDFSAYFRKPFVSRFTNPFSDLLDPQGSMGHSVGKADYYFVA